MIISGGIMVSSNLSGFLANTNFLVKMVFVLGLVINSFAIGKLMKLAINNSYASLQKSDKTKLLISGAISVICWLGALTMAFTIEDGFSGNTVSAGGEQVVSNYLTEGKASTTASYSLAEVATHNLETDCWTMIGGKVYDITKYVHVHPGGVKNIMRVCGVDGTDTFTRKHAGDTKPNFMLKSMQIGVAAN
jgi:cytochrome b involved in lipid metabolism